MSTKSVHKAVAIIPARGNSKRIPKKNIVKLGNKPLIAHTIAVSLKAFPRENIFVSTDDLEIARIAKLYKVKVIKRPKELAADQTQTLPVLMHAIKSLESDGLAFDTIVVLQPTSPFRKTSTIVKGIKQLWDNWNKFNAVFSVKQSKFPPNWLLKTKGQYLKFILPNNFKKIRFQDLDRTYEFDGLIYIYKKEFLKKSPLYPFDGETSGYIISSKLEALDIDDLDDLKIARALLK